MARFAVKDYLDFRGGYCSTTPSELMADNELLTAENCQWRDGIVKRNGFNIYDAYDFSGFDNIRGSVRAYINSAWYTILALDDGSNVNFYYGATTTFTAIDNDYDWTTDKDVEFAVLDGKVVAVNGTDVPAVIYYDSAWIVKNLEDYDERTRSTANWYAGLWDDNGATTNFVDDTTNAQDSGADDFQIATGGTNNDGFYVASDYTFNKISITNRPQFDGSPVAEYAYWNGSSWTTVTPTDAPTWTDAEADDTIEWDLPFDSDGDFLWETYSVSETTSGIEGKFVFRVRFTTAPTSNQSADTFAISNTQYLRQIMSNDVPQAVVEHNSSIYLAYGNQFCYSSPNLVTGYKFGREGFFIDGGEDIRKMVSYKDRLVFFKENTIFTLNTTNFNAPVQSRPLTSVGTIASRSPVMVGDLIFFVWWDGIYSFDGNKAMKLSKHIKSDIESWTLTDAAGIRYQNEYWVSFPTNSIVLTCDPDTIRRDSIGDMRISFFKFTSYMVHEFLYLNGDSDSGLLLAVQNNAGTVALYRCDNGTTDEGTTAISMTLKTRYFDFGKFQREKGFIRLKYKIGEVSAAAGATHTLTLDSEDGDATEVITLTVPTGSRYYTDYITIPYTMDGLNLAVQLAHSAATAAKFRGFSISIVQRRF